MAWKRVTKIGDAQKTWIPDLIKSQYIKDAFNSSMSNPINTNAAIVSGAIDSYFESFGDTLINLSPPYKIAWLGVNYLDIDFDNRSLNLMLYFDSSSEFGNYDGANGDTPLLGYEPTSTRVKGMPVRISILVDDSTRKACIILGYYYSQSGSTYMGAVHNWFSDKVTAPSKIYEVIRPYCEVENTDPWVKDDESYSDIGGGKGDLDITSDAINLPSAPPSITQTGFIQIFTPTSQQLNDLSDYMWEGAFFENIIKLWNNPMDIIISLMQFPFAIPSGERRYVHAGNVITTVSMNYPSSQFIDLDCGEYVVKPFYASYLDYEPYTSCNIYLPYIGFQRLSMDDIMGKTLGVRYRIDLITGTCVANILCDGSIMYTFTGNCASNIPVNCQSFNSIAQSAVNIGLSMASIGPNSASTSDISSIASNVMAAKPDIQRSDSVSSNAGIFGPQKPYLVFSVPKICLPSNQNQLLGYPSFVARKIGDLSGYTEIEKIKLDNVSCTDEELQEILEIMKGGFFA